MRIIRIKRKGKISKTKIKKGRINKKERKKTKVRIN